MKFLSSSYDGGPDSGVAGFWLVECKPVGSIVLLRFSPGSREAYHSHAFNAVTWWLKGAVVEEDLSGEKRSWKPSLRPKYTRRSKFHRVIAGETGAWALSFRGPWWATWHEFKHGKSTTLGHGRVVLT